MTGRCPWSRIPQSRGYGRRGCRSQKPEIRDGESQGDGVLEVGRPCSRVRGQSLGILFNKLKVLRMRLSKKKSGSRCVWGAGVGVSPRTGLVVAIGGVAQFLPTHTPVAVRVVRVPGRAHRVPYVPLLRVRDPSAELGQRHPAVPIPCAVHAVHYAPASPGGAHVSPGLRPPRSPASTQAPPLEQSHAPHSRHTLRER